jgi:hypothetical protein
MYNGSASFHAGQDAMDEGIGGEQKMIVPLRASRLAKVMHGKSFFERRKRSLADRASANRILMLLQRLPY